MLHFTWPYGKVFKSLNLIINSTPFLPPFLQGNWCYNPTQIHQYFPWHTVQDSARASPLHRGLWHLQRFLCAQLPTPDSSGWLTASCWNIAEQRVTAATTHSPFETQPVLEVSPRKFLFSDLSQCKNLETVSCLVSVQCFTNDLSR